jgi:hypothetical protein
MAVPDSSPRASVGVPVRVPQMLALADGTFFPPGCQCYSVGPRPQTRGSSPLLTVNSCIKVRLDLQTDKSPVVVKGPFFPRVVNPRYRIRGTMCNARIQSSKERKSI